MLRGRVPCACRGPSAKGFGRSPAWHWTFLLSLVLLLCWCADSRLAKGPCASAFPPILTFCRWPVDSGLAVWGVVPCLSTSSSRKKHNRLHVRARSDDRTSRAHISPCGRRRLRYNRGGGFAKLRSLHAWRLRSWSYLSYLLIKDQCRFSCSASRAVTPTAFRTPPSRTCLLPTVPGTPFTYSPRRSPLGASSAETHRSPVRVLTDACLPGRRRRGPWGAPR